MTSDACSGIAAKCDSVVVRLIVAYVRAALTIYQSLCRDRCSSWRAQAETPPKGIYKPLQRLNDISVLSNPWPWISFHL
jgi:hypothetical protein